MKFIFLLSLVANVALGYLYLKEVKKPPLERSVVESAEPRVIEKKIFVRVPSKRVPTEPGKTQTQQAPEYFDVDQKAYELSAEKVSTDRERYLQETLDLAPEDLQKIEKVKKDFFKDADKLILGMGEPTIEQRRQLLDLEESREREFERIMGKTKWEQFKKHREEYNRKNYERQMDEQTLFIPMEI